MITISIPDIDTRYLILYRYQIPETRYQIPIPDTDIITRYKIAVSAKIILCRMHTALLAKLRTQH